MRHTLVSEMAKNLPAFYRELMAETEKVNVKMWQFHGCYGEIL